MKRTIVVVGPLAHQTIAKYKALNLDLVSVAENIEDQELIAKASMAIGLVVGARAVGKRVIESLTNLLVIGTTEPFADHVNLRIAGEHGIAVLASPVGNRNSVKEHVLFLMLAALREARKAFADVDKGLLCDPKISGAELCGSTIGIVGAGPIASDLAQVCISLKMKVLGYSRHAPRGLLADNPNVEQISSREELFSRADIVSLHESPSVGGQALSTDELFGFKQNAILINCVDPDGVDLDAADLACRQGRIRYCADIFPEDTSPSHPIFKNPNFIGTPRTAASTLETVAARSSHLLNSIVRYLDNGYVRNSANLPELVLSKPLQPGCGFSVLVTDRVGTIHDITSLLTQAKLSISTFANEATAEGGLEYILCSLHSKVPMDVIRQIEKIAGIIRVRRL